MSKFAIKSEAARGLGISEWMFNDLRQRGHLPELVMVGRYCALPADRLAEIRARLIREGAIKPAGESAAVAVGC